jgi:hypothetical protein
MPEDWRTRASYDESPVPAPRRAPDPVEFIEGDEF